MKKKTKLIGLKGVARGAVGGQKSLVVFDEILHLPTSTIDGFIEERGLATFQISHDKTGIFLSRSGDFGFVDNASGGRGPSSTQGAPLDFSGRRLIPNTCLVQMISI